jgi:hypothetical protein
MDASIPAESEGWEPMPGMPDWGRSRQTVTALSWALGPNIHAFARQDAKSDRFTIS